MRFCRQTAKTKREERKRTKTNIRWSGAPVSERAARGDAAAQAFDVCIVGGGINGAGIARDLAGRGAKVVLCEKDDLASHTSSSSTKLIHGGLRYLEYYEFSLVRKALAEREVLLQERAAHHVAAALRDAARPVDAAGVDDPHRPVPLRPPGAARGAAGLAHRRPAQPSGRRAAEAELHARASSIPTAGSTTPGSSS